MTTYTQKNIIEWNSLLKSEDRFKDFFESADVSNLLEYLERRLKHNVLQMIAQRGLVSNVFLTSRIKSTRSTYNKMRNIDWPLKVESFDGQSRIYLHELTKDLIGMRLICLGFDSQVKILEELVASGSIKISSCEYYSTHTRSYTSDYHKKILDLFKVSPSTIEVDRKRKKTLYESVHLTVVFTNTSDIIEQLQNTAQPYSDDELKLSETREKLIRTSRNKIISQNSPLIMLVPIEIQIRLMTDHIWAVDEHAMRYSPNKFSVKIREKYDEEMEELFQSLKYSCHAVEKIRQQIYRLSHSELEKDLVLTGNGYDLEGRLHYFKTSDERSDIQLLEALNSELNIFREKNDDETANNILQKILDFCEQHKTRHSENLLEVSDNIDALEFKAWGRQRIIFLIIGYLILRSSEEFCAISRRVHGSIANIFNWFTHSEEINHPNDDKEKGLSFFTKYVAARRIFELVQERDFVSYIHSKRAGDEGCFIFNDPIVPYRLASSKYLNKDFDGAANVMYRYFEERNGYGSLFDWNNCQMSTPKKETFYLRWSQYIWLSCSLDNSKIEDNLDSILDKLSQAISEEPSKTTYDAISWYVIIYFYALCFDILSPNNKYLSTFKNLTLRIESLPSASAEPDRNYIGRSMCDMILAIKDERWNEVNSLQEVANKAILSREDRHPGVVIYQYQKVLDNISQKYREHLSDFDQKKQKQIVFVSYDTADRNTVVRILASLRPIFLDIYFWDYKDDYAIPMAIVNGSNAPFNSSVSTILFLSEAYMKNKDLILEKKTVIVRKIKEGDAYPILPILLDVEKKHMDRYFPSELELSPVKYNSDTYDRNISAIKEFLNESHAD